MKLRIYNWNILKKSFPDVSFSLRNLKESLSKEFSVYNISSLSIIFASSKDTKALNTQFRKKDFVTDVLSFVVDEKPLSGEVYICPEYIQENFKEEEIIRDAVHGILHIAGEDHSLKFTPMNLKKEPMFVKQENILQNILNEINSGFRKPRKKIS
ncbi:MAG: rRNA maturation RNase YbeY [Candidatus Dojkabacteria bacterium]